MGGKRVTLTGSATWLGGVTFCKQVEDGMESQYEKWKVNKGATRAHRRRLLITQAVLINYTFPLPWQMAQLGRCLILQFHGTLYNRRFVWFFSVQLSLQLRSGNYSIKLIVSVSFFSKSVCRNCYVTFVFWTENLDPDGVLHIRPSFYFGI